MSNINLQSVVNFASTHVDLMPLAGVGGYTNEPALSICNDTISSLLIFPYDWKFNRVEMPMLVTTPNKQDVQFGGATAFTLGSGGSGVGIALSSDNAITESGNTVTVNTLEVHRFQVGQTVFMAGNDNSAYNSILTDDGTKTAWTNGWTLTAIPTPTSFQFTHTSSGLPTSGAPGILDFGWLTGGSLVEMNSTSSPQHVVPIEAVKDLPVWGRVAQPEKVCVLKDNGDGTLKIRFYGVPGNVLWGVNLVYQAKAPVKTALTDDWSPFPDEYSFVFRQALLYRMYRYINDPKQTVEFQKLDQDIQRALAGGDREQTDVHIAPAEPLMDWSW